jgi:hypothetical protein
MNWEESGDKSDPKAPGNLAMRGGFRLTKMRTTRVEGWKKPIRLSKRLR